MIDGLDKCPDLSNDAIAFIVKLRKNIQWSTNLIVDKRNKKPLDAKKISKIVGMSKSKTYDVMKELRESGLLIKDGNGYKLSTELIQKGGGK